MYKNEVEKPALPAQGHKMAGMPVKEMKSDAMDIAYGQAGVQGCKSDANKIQSQFKNYHWDGDNGASGY